MGNPNYSIYQLSNTNAIHRESLEKFIPDYMLNRRNLLVFGAVCEGYGLVGVLLASVCENIIEIEYIRVIDEMQGQGIGKSLVTALLALVDKAITPYMITMYIPHDPEHEQVIGFIDALGVFVTEEEKNTYYITAETIHTNEMIQQCVNREYSVRAYPLTEYIKQHYAVPRLTDFVKRQHQNDIQLADELVVKDFGGLSAENSFVIEKDDCIAAVLLTHFAKEGVLDISHVYFESDDGNYIGALLKGLYEAVKDSEIDVMFTTMSSKRRALADKFFEGPRYSVIRAIWCGLFPNELDEIMEMQG